MRRKSPSRSVSFAKSSNIVRPDCALSTEEGRLLFHNWRLRELTGYEQDELELFDTRLFWHDLAHRERIIELLRARGGQLLNEEVIWKTKQGDILDLLISYVQVAYTGGHVSISGAKRLFWLYDITPLRAWNRRVCAASGGSLRQSKVFRKVSSATTARTGLSFVIRAIAISFIPAWTSI